MRAWQVYAYRDGKSQHVGSVGESSEELARCAALSKFGASEEDLPDLDPGRKSVILPDEEFSVS
jgi:hypothetical protein